MASSSVAPAHAPAPSIEQTSLLLAKMPVETLREILKQVLDPVSFSDFYWDPTYKEGRWHWTIGERYQKHFSYPYDQPAGDEDNAELSDCHKLALVCKAFKAVMDGGIRPQVILRVQWKEETQAIHGGASLNPIPDSVLRHLHRIDANLTWGQIPRLFQVYPRHLYPHLTGIDAQCRDLYVSNTFYLSDYQYNTVLAAIARWDLKFVLNLRHIPRQFQRTAGQRIREQRKANKAIKKRGLTVWAPRCVLLRASSDWPPRVPAPADEWRPRGVSLLSFPHP